MSFIRNTIESLFGGSDAARATAEASEAQAAAQQEALDYLRETDAPLLEYREQALPALSAFFGLGGDSTQAIEELTSSPLYQANLEQMEEAVLRNQAATGGFRSGATQTGLADVSRQALNDEVARRIQGLSAFAFPSLSTGQQANIIQGIGQTRAQGITGAEQARQSAFGQGVETILAGAKFI